MSSSPVIERLTHIVLGLLLVAGLALELRAVRSDLVAVSALEGVTLHGVAASGNHGLTPVAREPGV